MNNLRRTVSTIEIAEMMEINHWETMRKLDGRFSKGKRVKGYVDILTDNQMVVSDYFIPSTYKDASGKENKCYGVTKIGCDFLANKFTGEKGILFTARYVKKFDEMEHKIELQCPIESATLRGVASIGCLIERAMKKQGSRPDEVTTVLDSLFKQSGIVLPECFVKIPDHIQLSLSGFTMLNIE